MLRWSWDTIIRAGLFAGLVFLLMEMVLVGTVGGGSPWAPPRMMGAILLGPDVLPPPATFDAVIVLAGLLVHFALSVVLALVFAVLVGQFTTSRMPLIALGVAFGAVVYAVNFFGFTEIFPWFAMARNWITIVSHLVFGGLIGWWLAGRV